MSLLLDTIQRKGHDRPPVWFMRQAGRYHSHYQAIRKDHSFIEMCKRPELAIEITMGPIRAFDFDAAILFSDLLFPLEALGMGLRYEPGPKLDWYLREAGQVSQLATGGKSLISQLHFQAEAIQGLRMVLPQEKALIGFVGGLTTLYTYAVEGSHLEGVQSAVQGFQDGRWLGFCERLIPLLVENMVLQAEAGAEVIAVFDTSVGDYPVEEWTRVCLPLQKKVLEAFRHRCSKTPIIYYSKNTSFSYWDEIHASLAPDVLGIDWKTPISQAIQKYPMVLEGNLDPQDLFLPRDDLRKKFESLMESVMFLEPENRQRWIFGLGHGVLPGVPESNVRDLVQWVREIRL